jgi:dinuclear metal center YbgI/SA1388 family protein
MKLADIITVLEVLAPLRYAESWDNVGLLVGDPRADVTNVLVTVDYTTDVAAEARAARATLVVAYHPPMFAPVKRVPHDALWADAIRRDVALYSPHTALDVARDGTNDFLADACGISESERRPLRRFTSKSREASPEPEGIGLGRIGAITPAPRRALLERIKAQLGLSYVLASGPLDTDATCVAVSAGAGGEQLEEAIRAGADVFVTGEIRHHDALSAARRGVSVFATLHSNSERAAVRSYAERLASRLEGVNVTTSTADRDPFTVL